VDNKGIDFVIRKGEDAYCDVEVKSVRGLSYVFFPKSVFQPRKNLLGAVVLFIEGKAPRLYLMPANAWLRPNAPLVSRDHDGKKSKAEWGTNISHRNLPLLARYGFHKQIDRL